MKKCQGTCPEHRGDVERVRVIDEIAAREWGEFWYCQDAIALDTANGFKVERVTDVERTSL